MEKRLFFVLLALLIVQITAAAGLSGKVLDASTGKPMDAVTVFVSGTTRSTITKPDGSFFLEGLIVGAEKLVFDHMGYFPVMLTSESCSQNTPLMIQMKIKTHQLGEVRISSKYQYAKEDMNEFLFAFFGDSEYGRKCRILNPEVLRFKRQSLNRNNSHRLTVTADSAILIENNLLGYTIRYTLESFSMSPTETYFKGYSLFIDNMNERNRKKIQRARENSYAGSSMHFLRSLYAGTLEQEGFRIYKLIEQKDTANLPRHYGVLKDSVFVADSSSHLLQTLTPCNIYNDLIKSTDAASLNLKNPVEVRYIYSGEERAYSRNPFYHEGMTRNYKQQHTLIRFLETPFVFYPNGNAKNFSSLVTIGYWSYKKMGELLPCDYTPANTKNY